MEDLILSKDTFVMCSEPSPDLTIEKANETFREIKSEAELASLFAIVENKAWWIEDEQYDFGEGTEEYKKAAERTRAWFSLADTLKGKIFEILKSENIEIPTKNQMIVLEPFMKRNGFQDAQGWWIKE